MVDDKIWGLSEGSSSDCSDAEAAEAPAPAPRRAKIITADDLVKHGLKDAPSVLLMPNSDREAPNYAW
jgi:hypothetical protein